MDAFFRDQFFTESLCVALQGICQAGTKIVADYFIFCSQGRRYVQLALQGSGVGVVYHKTGAGAQAKLQELSFAVAGAQQIHADANMCIKKVLLVVS